MLVPDANVKKIVDVGDQNGQNRYQQNSFNQKWTKFVEYAF